MPTAPGPIEPALARMDEDITLWVAGGFASRDDMVRGAVWLTRNLLGKHRYSDEMLRPHAERLADQRLRDHVQRQQGWPAITDCDRLDAAFAELERDDILALPHCGNDDTGAGAHLWGEAVPQARAAGREPKAYVFFNQQTTHGAVRGEGLYLVCGPIPEPEGPAFRAAAAKVAALVAEALRRHGLAAAPTDYSPYVLHVPMDWKRRRGDPATPR